MFDLIKDDDYFLFHPNCNY